MSADTTVSAARPIVLVLNTNADTVEMLRAVLDEAGFLTISSYVDELARGETTLEPLLRTHPPDAVVYDIALPYDRQWAFMEHLQQIPLLKDVPFVLTTTNVKRVQEVVEEANREIHEIVGKPYDLEEVVRAVRRGVASRAAGASPTSAWGDGSASP